MLPTDYIPQAPGDYYEFFSDEDNYNKDEKEQPIEYLYKKD